MQRLLRPARLAAAHDALMAAASFWLALYLRWGSHAFEYSQPFLVIGTLAFAVLAAGIFGWRRLYKGVWRYASMPDLLAITQAVTFCILLFYGTWFIANRLDGVPRSIPFIHWLALLALLGGPRFAYRIVKDRSLSLFRMEARTMAEGRMPVLLVGAGDHAELFIREAQRNPQFRYQPVGIVDHDAKTVGQVIHNIRIFGAVSALPEVVEKLARRGLRPQRIVLADEARMGGVIRDLFELCNRAGVPLARMPRLEELRGGMERRVDLRPVAVEDLLGRRPAALDRGGMERFIAGRKVLITGAGGTIGGELTRQIASFRPSELLLYEVSEYHLYQMTQELAEFYPDLCKIPLLGDVRDGAHVEAVFAEFTPEIVFHAAAIKHVPIAEENPEEAILTNALGTRNVAESCLRHRAAAMVMISTDKAVNPANVMGASKRLAESLCQALGAEPEKNAGNNAGGAAATRTRFITVRFGNVLGSTGSVVPLFEKQLARGGPLTVTHPDMVRYFMIVREAVELVLQSAALGVSMEDGGAKVFVLDMGQPVRIQELAEQMIRLAGLLPQQDIRIEYTGLRPGEKLFEELFYDSEHLVKTGHEHIMLATPRAVRLQDIAVLFDDLIAACRARKTGRALDLLKALVPEYAPGGGI